jgi:hypothetical protein
MDNPYLIPLLVSLIAAMTIGAIALIAHLLRGSREEQDQDDE